MGKANAGGTPRRKGSTGRRSAGFCTNACSKLNIGNVLKVNYMLHYLLPMSFYVNQVESGVGYFSSSQRPGSSGVAVKNMGAHTFPRIPLLI